MSSSASSVPPISSAPTSPPQAKPSPHFGLLDALRGIAAVWVMLFHIEVSQFIPRLAAALPAKLNLVLFNWGQYSVLGFFVLSGFVIAHSLRHTVVSWHSLSQFCQRRLARLSPPYYFAIALFFAWQGCQTYWGWKTFPLDFTLPSALQLLSHLFYIQELAGFDHYDGVYWTICLEIQFYLSFILLLGLSQWLHRRFAIAKATGWVFTAWTLFCFLYNSGQTGLPFYRPLFLGWHFSFLAGVYAYWAWQRRCHPAVGYGYAGFIAVTAPMSPAFAIAVAGSSSFILAAGQLHGLSSWLGGKVCQFLGKISYSLYLTHVTTNSIFFSFWMQRPNQTVLTDLMGLLLCMATDIGLATAAYYLIEKPAIRWSQSLKKPIPSTNNPASS